MDNLMRLPIITLNMLCNTLVFLGVLMLSSTPLQAHELWIEAQDFRIELQGRLVADIVNGENFRGHALPYLPQSAVRFDLASSAAAEFIVAPIVARAGDRPALSMPALDEGLVVVIYQAAAATLTYHQAEKFWDFVAHKDLPITQAAHRARGLPDEGFREVYSRYSKALVAVGAGIGEDRNMGLETELVALANPYTAPLPGGVPVQVFYAGEPRADAQIEVFDRNAEGTVTVSTVRSNANGVAMIPVTAGHTYMLDAVVLRRPSAELAAETGAVWESLWANLTFAVPASD